MCDSTRVHYKQYVMVMMVVYDCEILKLDKLKIESKSENLIGYATGFRLICQFNVAREHQIIEISNFFLHHNLTQRRHSNHESILYSNISKVLLDCE